MSQLKELRDRRAKIVQQGEQAMTELNGISASDAEKWDAGVKAVTEAKAALDAVDAEIVRAEALADAERAFSVVGRVEGGRPRIEDDPKRGFRSLGEFVQAVKGAAERPSMTDERLRIGAAPTTVANEGTGADGGYLVPTEYSSQIWTDSMEGQAIAPMTTDVPVTGNSMVFPKDEDEAHTTTAGIQMYWEGENQQITQSKPSLGAMTLRLAKLIGLVPITDELASDQRALSGYLDAKIPAVVRHKFNDALLNGTGAGLPRGVIGHGGTVSVAKEGSQAAATIVIENVLKMYSRAINPMRGVWLANIDTFPQIYDMKDNSGNRVYQTSVAGLPDQMAGSLIGRPLMFVEECQTLGTVGDLVFGDWAEYVMISKGGIRQDFSEHLWFDYDTGALRVKTRADGQPWRSTTFTPAKGANARGNFVTLATRA